MENQKEVLDLQAGALSSNNSSFNDKVKETIELFNLTDFIKFSTIKKGNKSTVILDPKSIQSVEFEKDQVKLFFKNGGQSSYFKSQIEDVPYFLNELFKHSIIPIMTVISFLKLPEGDRKALYALYNWLD